MDRLTPQQIAVKLFWINLLPGLLAVAMIGYGLLHLNNSVGNWGIQSISTSVLLISGAACEFVYLLLAWDAKYAQSRGLWLYTLVVNGLFIIGYIVSAIISLSSPIWVLIVYPICFFCAGYTAIKRSGQSVGPA